MALACKCDRCGKYFDIPKNGGIRKIRVGLIRLIDPISIQIKKRIWIYVYLVLKIFDPINKQ